MTKTRQEVELLRMRGFLSGMCIGSIIAVALIESKGKGYQKKHAEAFEAVRKNCERIKTGEGRGTKYYYNEQQARKIISEYVAGLVKS